MKSSVAQHTIPGVGKSIRILKRFEAIIICVGDEFSSENHCSHSQLDLGKDSFLNEYGSQLLIS